MRTIPAGVMDAGMAALATFVVGVYAVTVLDPVSLGAYALVFSAFAMLMEVPARLVFQPAEIDAAKRPKPERLGVLAHSVRQGAVVAFPAGVLVGPVALTVPREVDPTVVLALTLTAIPCTMISPAQDHLRKMLHIGGRSWSAAVVSGAQLGAIAMAVAGLSLAGVPAPWQPFGALAIANVVSSSVGLIIWWRIGAPRLDQALPLPALMRSGKWLLLGNMATGIGGFGAALLVAHLVSAQTLGYAQAARILARPIAMLSQGIKAVLGPGLMRAGARLDPVAARRLSRQYAVLVAGLGCAYLLLVSFDWVLNPLSALMPNAYVVPGLVAATIAVYIVDRIAGAGAGLQLLGAGRERMLAIGESVASVGRLLGGATAPATAAFAIPLGYLIMSIVRRSWLRYLVRRLYAGSVASKAGNAR